MLTPHPPHSLIPKPDSSLHNRIRLLIEEAPFPWIFGRGDTFMNPTNQAVGCMSHGYITLEIFGYADENAESWHHVEMWGS